MSAENPDDGLTEKIKILATDDEKIKSFGELFTNDSSREILQLLFNEELTANQIAQKTDISLQLVKYHLNKLQDLGVVKITKIEKNSKSQDMKVYSATKFSIVIVPPKLSEKTKESKLLVRSFRHIYKVAGFAIATGVSGLLSLSQLQTKPIPVSDTRQFTAPEELSKRLESADESASSMIASAPVAESEPQDFAQGGLDITETTLDSGIDLFIPFVIITMILGGLTAYYVWKYKKSN
ncbi:ArsR family transcriptional regulator [Candidatus Nitrosopumilus koreensis AR1]|uniref:ArsR family transcriptional regulator n=1 Tax=Candidatus Nitrosopumilus koreensis AR1 TaxID=1229908 RepID=K0B4R2_9ARCH|nr:MULTISPECIES: winged helix-turn-helix domain-containing protein [Nitrosopumilus]AFS80389.1 ArsR family transcriptional regulator [Candidatus Nitrosopumilus koreensis AR1]